MISKPKMNPESMPEDEPRDGPGRPRFELDLEMIERAAMMGCTKNEVATLAGMSHSGFYKRMETDEALVDALQRGQDKGRSTLRRLQWQGAQSGNPTMLIWLGKQLLGQRDKQELSSDPDNPLTVIYRWADKPVAEDDGQPE